VYARCQLDARPAKSGNGVTSAPSKGWTRGVRGAGRLPGIPRAKQLFAHAEKYHSSNKKNNDAIFIFLLLSNN